MASDEPIFVEVSASGTMPSLDDAGSYEIVATVEDSLAWNVDEGLPDVEERIEHLRIVEPVVEESKPRSQGVDLNRTQSKALKRNMGFIVVKGKGRDKQKNRGGASESIATGRSSTKRPQTPARTSRRMARTQSTVSSRQPRTNKHTDAHLKQPISLWKKGRTPSIVNGINRIACFVSKKVSVESETRAWDLPSVKEENPSLPNFPRSFGLAAIDESREDVAPERPSMNSEVSNIEDDPRMPAPDDITSSEQSLDRARTDMTSKVFSVIETERSAIEAKHSKKKVPRLKPTPKQKISTRSRSRNNLLAQPHSKSFTHNSTTQNSRSRRSEPDSATKDFTVLSSRSGQSPLSESGSSTKGSTSGSSFTSGSYSLPTSVPMIKEEIGYSISGSSNSMLKTNSRSTNTGGSTTTGGVESTWRTDSESTIQTLPIELQPWYYSHSYSHPSSSQTRQGIAARSSTYGSERELSTIPSQTTYTESDTFADTTIYDASFVTCRNSSSIAHGRGKGPQSYRSGSSSRDSRTISSATSWAATFDTSFASTWRAKDMDSVTTMSEIEGSRLGDTTVESSRVTNSTRYEAQPVFSSDTTFTRPSSGELGDLTDSSGSYVSSSDSESV